jgi:hypothetical protein
MGIWEVNLPTPGTYTFEVDVTAGNANVGTSIYQGDDVALSKSGYFTGGYSNSSGAGGDESFTIVNPYTDMYFGWAVWKVGSGDMNQTSTFNLTWGPVSATEPMSVDDLVIERFSTIGARLTWSQVTEDINGNPLSVDYYRIHRSLDPGFTPTSADSIGYTTAPDTTFDDIYAVILSQKYFYNVIAVDTDGVDVAEPRKEASPRIITRYPPRSDAPDAVRSRH